ncbi:MAG: hypothetical protein FWD55_08550 [Propionibacteriaceae bacterium]|nr:hypothetical protein [Propionibacteriaceae bacterium]
MIEIPEASTLARQCAETLTGKTITSAVAASSPHGFAWYANDPGAYGDLLTGKTITGGAAHGGHPEIEAEEMRICVGEGVNIRFYEPGAQLPTRHQLKITFDDGSAICCTVSMYGFLGVFPDGMNDDYYYLVGKEKPSPLTDEFDEAYFQSMITDETLRLSGKAFLATEQRIPGLGNGVVQDVLWEAKVHPKRKLNTLGEDQLLDLYHQVKQVLTNMTHAGGRSTEKDLFGNPGGYEVILCRTTVGLPCSRCGTPIKRMAYLGGNVYVCEGCQPLT